MPEPIKFINRFQEDVYYCRYRNQCASGGFGNGKTFVYCLKLHSLCIKFPKYKVAIFRQTGADLRRTTVQTYKKICTPEFYTRWREDIGVTTYKNGSEILWMHLEHYDENELKSLEVNTVFVDQAEELSFDVYKVLEGRVGRWDQAEIPSDLDPKLFPLNPVTGKPRVPSYMCLAVNPEGFEHFIYQRYHEDSIEYHKQRMDINGRKYRYSDTHKMFHGKTTDNPALDPENVQTHLSQDESYVKRFVLGEWGITSGIVHTINKESILDDVPTEFYNEFTTQGNLYRILDHGGAGPGAKNTCCIWASVYKYWIILYREYRQIGLISEHRRNIHELSVNLSNNQFEKFKGQFADPDIFRKKAEKYGTAWSVADDYVDNNLDAPPIFWQKADNNEMVTRNRIGEYLTINPKIPHPITGKLGSPRLYFLQRGEKYPEACEQVILETRIQRRKKLSSIGGIDSFSEERQRGVPDDAYDCLRYLVSQITTYKYKRSSTSLNGTFMKTRREAISSNHGIKGQRPLGMPFKRYYGGDQENWRW